MKTLIVYNIIPDDIQFFIVPDSELKPEWVKMLELAHGKCVNIDERNDGMEWMESASSPKKEYCSNTVLEEFHCCLRPYKISAEDTLNGPFTKVYYTGFFL